jgi:hypothetical protein
VLKSILIVEQTINTWGVTLGLDTCRYWTPAWVLFKARVFPILGPWDPIAGGPDPILGVRLTHVEVLDQLWRSGLYIQGSDALPWGSGLIVDALGYITFSGHGTASDLPMWWSRAPLWTQSSRLGLGQVMVWSHTQQFHHATK